MSIKPHPEKPGMFIVRVAERHPVTRKPIDRKREVRTLAEAKRVEKQLILEMQDILKRETVPIWSRVLGEFLEDMRLRGLTQNTIYDYEKCLSAHTLESWGDLLVDAITTQQVRDLLQQRVGHRTPGHQKYMLKCIKAVFTCALDKGYIQRNPVPQIKFKLGDKIKQVLTEEQVRLLLTKAREHSSDWYFHWALAVYTGLRNGELYALSWDKVDLDKRQILVSCSWNNKDGFKSTKSGDDRIVEIAPTLVTVLKELRLQTYDSNFVLPRLEKWDRGEQARELKMFLMGIGLAPIRFHDLRATWATILLSHGVEPIKVMKLGGWKSMETMMIYIRKAGVDVKGSTDCLALHNPEVRTAQLLQFPGIS